MASRPCFDIYFFKRKAGFESFRFSVGEIRNHKPFAVFDWLLDLIE
jgi:hypothetical protein